MKKDYTNNSYFTSGFKRKKILVLAPHHDDEINLAGLELSYFIKNDADVYIAYSTNSDFAFSSERRVKETIDACKVFGIKAYNIILMGYGDTPNKSLRHIYRSGTICIESESKHTSTYGVQGIYEYCYKKYGVHNQYCSDNYMNDLKDIITEIRADIIICVDLDEHPDHKMLSIYFEHIMDSILKEKNNDYFPLVLKRFAYPYAYYSYRNYPAINIASTKRPICGDIQKYSKDIHDQFNYIWKERVRFPVPEQSQTIYFWNNTVVNALKCYKSQYGFSHITKIIKSDFVCWERRTDNCVYGAKVSVSSGNRNYLFGFPYVRVDDVLNDVPRFECLYWHPSEDDLQRRATITWEDPIDISIISFIPCFQRNCKHGIRIILDDEIQMMESNVRNNVIHKLQINCKRKISKIDLFIDNKEDKYMGIFGLEVYKTNYNYKSPIKPFVKVTIDDQFVYNFHASRNCREIVLGVYKFHTDLPVKFILVSGNATIINNKLQIFNNRNPIIIKCNLIGDELVYDQIQISFDAEIQNLKVKCIRLIYKLNCLIQNSYSKILRLYLYIKRIGLVSVLKKFI